MNRFILCHTKFAIIIIKFDVNHYIWLKGRHLIETLTKAAEFMILWINRKTCVQNFKSNIFVIWPNLLSAPKIAGNNSLECDSMMINHRLFTLYFSYNEM